jgi:putative transposase
MKLSKTETDGLYTHLNLSAAATSYIEGVRSAEPSRAVQSSDHCNVIYRYASKKMGGAVAVESAEEYTFATLQEFDDNVLEYWDQPTSVSVQYLAKDGRYRRATYTPDFLILKKDKVELVQVKTSGACAELVKDRPGRWQWIDGGYHDLAAEEYFSNFGLSHSVFIEGQNQKIRAENCRLLVHLRDQEADAPSPRQAALILEHLETNGVTTLDHLIRTFTLKSATPLLHLIAAGTVHTDLSRFRTAETQSCFVGADAEQVSRYLNELDSLNSTSTLPSRFMSPEEVSTTHSRWKQVQGEAATSMSRTTMWRMRRKLHISGGDPLSLLPQHWRKGNRTKRVVGSDLDVMKTAVQQHFLSPTSPTYSFAYDQYLLDHAKEKKKGNSLQRPASINRFILECKLVDPCRTGKARGGRRLAYAMMQATDPSVRQLKASRAFERAHIDHQQLDRHVIIYGAGKGRQTKRPWITVMRDEFSGAIIAMAISLKSPSRFRCQAVLRDCARRNGRLPECLVSDNGGDFHSAYFEMFLAQQGITKQTRPPDFPKGSGEIESAFASLSSFIKFTAGGTYNDVKGRKASSTHRSRSTAIFDLVETYRHVEDYFFRSFNLAPKSHAESPDTRLRTSLEKWPISGREAVLNADFLRPTAVELSHRLKVHPSGVRHFGRWFSHPKLFSSFHKGYVTAYEEPWDQDRLYVLLNGERVTCCHAAGNHDDVPNPEASIRAILFNEGQDVIALAKKDARLSNAKRYRNALEGKRDRPTTKVKPQAETLPPSQGVLPFKRRKDND